MREAIRTRLYRQSRRIKARLEEAGWKLREVDREFGLGRDACSNCLRLPHEPAEQAIATVLGVHPASLWPERYDKNGERLKQNYKLTPKRTRQKVAGRQPATASLGASQESSHLEAAE
jgi:Ner family transcriptional regulator